jgi:hypothetical protein
MPKPATNFFDVVHLLRQLEPRYQLMALFAAQFWSDEKLEAAERNGDLPGRDGELKLMVPLQ